MTSEQQLVKFLRRDFVPQWKECEAAAKRSPSYLKAIREGLIESGVSAIPFVGPATLGFLRSIGEQRQEQRFELIEAVLGLDDRQRRGIGEQIGINPSILEEVKEFYTATSATHRDEIVQVVERVSIELSQEHDEIREKLEAIERALGKARIVTLQQATELAGVPTVGEAVGDGDRKVLQAPTSAAEYLERGRVYLERKLYDNALGDFQTVIDMDKSISVVYYYRARIHKEQGRLPEALADYNTCIRVNSGDYVALEGRGNLYADTGQYKKALRDYRAAIGMNKTWWILYFDRGLIFGRRKAYHRAIKNYSLAIRFEPNESFLYGLRGMAYFDVANYEKAVSDLSMAIALDPEDDISYSLRGMILGWQGSYETAIQDLSRSIELEPNEAETYCRRGYIYQKKGDYDKAVTDYRKTVEFLVSDTDYAYADRVLRRMLRLIEKCERELVLPDLKATLAVIAKDYRMREKWGKTMSQRIFSFE